jgi:hypothetical protein
MVTLAWEISRRRRSSSNPIMVTVADCPTERFLIVAQVAASGTQVRAPCSSELSFGSSLVGATHRGSISPTWNLSPRALKRLETPSAKWTSTAQATARSSASRQTKVGRAMSGGKTDPSTG